MISAAIFQLIEFSTFFPIQFSGHAKMASTCIWDVMRLPINHRLKYFHSNLPQLSLASVANESLSVFTFLISNLAFRNSSAILKLWLFLYIRKPDLASTKHPTHSGWRFVSRTALIKLKWFTSKLWLGMANPTCPKPFRSYPKYRHFLYVIKLAELTHALRLRGTKR